MIIPNEIKVGQFTYKVKFVNDELRDEQGHRLYGQARHYEKEIVLDIRIDKISSEETFIHEIIHCLDAIYKFSDKGLSEGSIERMGIALHKFILDNPKIFK